MTEIRMIPLRKIRMLDHFSDPALDFLFNDREWQVITSIPGLAIHVIPHSTTGPGRWHLWIAGLGGDTRLIKSRKPGPRYLIEAILETEIGISRQETASLKWRPAPVSSARNVVYFIKCQGFVKIGTASNFSNRLTGLQTASPFDLEVLATIPGDTRKERELHERFREFHHRLEWFRLEGELANFVSSLSRRAA